MRVLQVDPSLFTRPYDAALSRALEDAGVQVVWATRPRRPDEEPLLVGERKLEIFYRSNPGSAKGAGLWSKLRKGWSHVKGLAALIASVKAERCDVVHLQWAVLPIADAFAITTLRRRMPVVFTVHDVTPFNDSPSSSVQRVGFGRVLAAADALIVHTQGAKLSLSHRGVVPEKIHVIGHGPLATFSQDEREERSRSGGRWRYLLFGKLQGYKGIDILVEAAGLLTQHQREAIEIRIVGEPLIDLAPVKKRIKDLHLEQCVSLQPGIVAEADLKELLLSSDAYVFPYRSIDASGVLHLVMNAGRWLVASDLGAFRDVIIEGRNGSLVEPGRADELAQALWEGVGRRSEAGFGEGEPWSAIAVQTRNLYAKLLDERRGAR